MVKKLFLVIFISVLTIGCDNQIVEPDLWELDNTETNIEANYYLNMSSYLEKNENGYYMMEFLNSYNQTFTTLKAETGSDDYYQKVKWISNKEINIGGEWINSVNNNSYTDENGDSYTVLAAWEQMINDTIKIYAGYTDQYGNHYVDSLEVIILDEE